MIGINKYIKILSGIMAIWFSVGLYAQSEGYLLKGRVVGDGGMPISNASVSVEGAFSSPIITNEEGLFEIDIPDGNVWLLISPVGNYKTKRVYLDGRKNLTLNIISTEQNSVYDEVPSMQGSMAKRDIIGSFENVNLEGMFDQATQTITQNLIGKVPGLLGYNHSGMPGDGTYSYMRGIRSLHTNNQPMLIADGIPIEKQGIFRSIISAYNYDPLTSIYPGDITGLTVLKDAVETVNYGLKSSNGLIMVETLKPTETKTIIDFSFRTGYSLSPDQIPVLDNNQYRTLGHEVLITSDYLEEDYPFLFPGLFEDSSSNAYYRYNHNTNWQDEVFRNAFLYDVGLSIKGGDAISKYGLSVGFQSYDGIIKNTNYNSLNLRFVGSFNVFKWLELYVSTSLNNNQSTLKETGYTASTSPILSGLFKSPVMAPYQFDEYGHQLSFLDDVDAFGVSNPTAVISKSEAYNQNYKFLGTFRLIGHINKYFQWNSWLGINFGNMKESLFLPNVGMESYMEEEGYNEVRQQASYLRSIYFDNTLKYEKSFNTKHHLIGRVGLRINTNHSEADIGVGRNTPSDEYKSLRFAQTILAEISGDIGTWNWMSLYSDLNYKFKDKYLLGLGLSVDGSSRTGEDADTPLTLFGAPFGLFYSAGGAWRISSEQFLENVSAIDELKLRASFGLSGNDDIGNYSSRRYYSQLKYRETTGVILGAKPTTDLKYESNQAFNIGLDLNMFRERLNITFGYFSVKTLDMIIFERQEDYIGYQYRPTNGGEVENKGFELGIFGRLVNASNFKFDIGFNIAQYKNKVLSIKGGSLVTEIEGGEILSHPGDPVNSYFGYVYEGVFSSGTEANEAGLVNNIGMPFNAGDAKFSDISGPDGIPDHVINEFDKTIIGSPNPDFYGGLEMIAMYKRWTLSANMQFNIGNEIYNYTRYQTEQMTGLHNQSTSVLNRWQHEGQVTEIPRASWNDPLGNSSFSSRWIEDGSFIRIKNITLAYSVNEKFLVFKSARIFATAINLFTFTDYLGYDPEFSYSYDQLLLGIDYGMVPQSRTFMIGVKFGI